LPLRGWASRAERPIRLPFARHSCTISRTLPPIFPSLLGNQLRARLLPGSSGPFRAF